MVNQENESSIPPEAENDQSHLGVEVKGVQSLISLVSSILGSFLGFGLLATLSGVIVVNQDLAQYTDIHSFNISPNRYIAAGIPVLVIGIVVFIGVPALGYLGWLTGRLDKSLETPSEENSKPVIDLARLHGIWKYLWELLSILLFHQAGRLMTLVILVGVALFISIIGGLLYGGMLHRALPGYLGGGQPVSAQLVFKEKDMADLLGLSTDPTDKSSRRTMTVWILTDLVDGYLVLDRTTGRVAAVKSESLQAVLDSIVRTQFIATATPTATP